MRSSRASRPRSRAWWGSVLVALTVVGCGGDGEAEAGGGPDATSEVADVSDEEGLEKALRAEGVTSEALIAEMKMMAFGKGNGAWKDA